MQVSEGARDDLKWNSNALHRFDDDGEFLFSSAFSSRAAAAASCFPLTTRKVSRALLLLSGQIIESPGTETVSIAVLDVT